MPNDHDAEIFKRIGELETGHARTEEWKSHMIERMKKTEEKVDGVERISMRSDIRLTIIIGILVFAAGWIFRH